MRAGADMTLMRTSRDIVAGGLQRSDGVHHRKAAIVNSRASVGALPLGSRGVENSSSSGNPLISAHKELLQNWHGAAGVT